MPYDQDALLAAVWHAVLSVTTRPPADVPDPELQLLDGGAELDSVQLVELIAALESQLCFQFHDTDLRTHSFRTLGTLATVVAARLGTR